MSGRSDVAAMPAFGYAGVGNPAHYIIRVTQALPS